MNDTLTVREPENPSPVLLSTQAIPSEIISPTKINRGDSFLMIHEDGDPDLDLKR